MIESSSRSHQQVSSVSIFSFVVLSYVLWSRANDCLTQVSQKWIIMTEVRILRLFSDLKKGFNERIMKGERICNLMQNWKVIVLLKGRRWSIVIVKGMMMIIFVGKWREASWSIKYTSLSRATTTWRIMFPKLSWRLGSAPYLIKRLYVILSSIQAAQDNGYSPKYASPDHDHDEMTTVFSSERK